MRLPLVLASALSHALLFFSTSAAASPGSLEGSIFFTTLQSNNLVRLDQCAGGSCAAATVLAGNVSLYGGLLFWPGHGGLLAAQSVEKGHHVVQLDPWCHAGALPCPSTSLVDVDRALGGGEHGSFSVAGMAWCQGSLFIVFGGKSGATGVLRCSGCSAGVDCTPQCSLVNGGPAPGRGPRELSGFAAGAACLGDDRVLVADNENFRIQAIPANCTQAPCDVRTFASGMKWPLGIAVVKEGERVLVTLDGGIVALGPDGALQQEQWSSREDTGFLCEGGGQILAASGGDGNIVSFDGACGGPNCTETVVWKSTSHSARSAGAIAYIPKTARAQHQPQTMTVLIA